MEETAEERLNRLQEADLGTARREHISTADHGFRETRVQVIEATRKSNVPGTKEQRIATTNKSRLDGWANMHKTVGDTDGLEELDDLLHGQTHRLSLTEALHGGGAPQQGPAGRGRGIHRSGGPGVFSFPNAPPRPASASSGSSSFPPSSEHSSRHSQQRPNFPRAVASGLDPALERNNVTNNAKAARVQIPLSKRVTSAQNAPIPKTRAGRPLPSFSVPVCSAAEFLAEARRLRQSPNQPPSENSATQISAAAESRPSVQPSSRPTPELSSNLGEIPRQKVSAQRSSSTPVKNAELQPKPSAAPGASPEEDARAFLKKIGNQNESTTKSKNVADGTTKPAPSPQKIVGTLLDLDFTAESEAIRSPALDDLQGLDFEDSSTPQSSIPSPLAVPNRKFDFGGLLQTEQEQSSEALDMDGTTDPVDEELAAEYKREIDIICELLERTSLSETFHSKLTECKQELETRLRLRRTPKVDTAQSQQLLISPVSEPALPAAVFSKQEEHKVVVTELKVETVAPDARKETPQHEHTRTTSSVSQGSTPSSQSRLNAAAPQFMPNPFSEYRSLSNATSTDSSTVFQPTPSRVVPKPQSESVSSDTATVTAREERDSPVPPAEPTWTDFTPSAHRVSSVNHIFGDHLLPGGRARRPVEIKKPVEIQQPVEVKKTEGAHLFGDHNLPGRRVTPSNPIVTVSSTRSTASILTHAAAPKPAPVTFSIPPKPQPLKMTNPNNAGFSKAKTQENSVLTANAPPKEPENKKVLSSKPTNVVPPTKAAKPTGKPAQKTTSIMESMYAPKPQGASSSTTAAKKSSENKGLSASKYSNAHWV